MLENCRRNVCFFFIEISVFLLSLLMSTEFCDLRDFVEENLVVIHREVIVFKTTFWTTSGSIYSLEELVSEEKVSELILLEESLTS